MLVHTNQDMAAEVGLGGTPYHRGFAYEPGSRKIELPSSSNFTSEALAVALLIRAGFLHNTTEVMTSSILSHHQIHHPSSRRAQHQQLLRIHIF